MLPYWVIAAIISVPCNSVVEHVNNVTIVQQCKVPLVQGPPSPPTWWRAGMLDKAKPTQVEKPKYTYTKKYKKKKLKKRRK